MKQHIKHTLLISIMLTSLSSTTLMAKNVLPAANGISYPTDLKNWRVIASSYRKDNDTQRVILGNSVAINASNSGQTNPWPKGTILAKLVWKNAEHPVWQSAIVPGAFIHSEIMVKDSAKYKSTDGWGYARWKGKNQEPHGADASFANECVACHKQAKESDFVFTHSAFIP